MNLANYIKFLIHTVWLRIDKNHSAPLTINVHITDLCPNTCRYCSFDSSDKSDLSLEELKNIFREIRSLGGVRLNLTGGEPLLRKDLAQIISAAKRLGFFVSIATSGVGMKTQIEGLKRCDLVMLSFDGPQEIRENLCGPACSQEAEEAVQLLKKSSIPFWTTTVLTKENISHIDWIVGHAQKHSARANFVLLQTQPGNGIRFHPKPDDVRELMPSTEEYKKAIAKIIQLKKKGLPIGSSNGYLKRQLNWKDYGNVRSSEPTSDYQCMAGRGFCEISSDGTLFNCGWERAWQGGISVRENTFRQAFQKMNPVQGCQSCISSCQLESNLIFNLKPDSILNWAKCLIKG